MRRDIIFKLNLITFIMISFSGVTVAAPLSKAQSKAVTQGCIIRAYELGLKKPQMISWCSCIVLNTELLFKLNKKPTLDQLWSNVYEKCSIALKEKT